MMCVVIFITLGSVFYDVKCDVMMIFMF